MGEPLNSDSFYSLKAQKTKWSRLPDLNRRPTDYESVALPTELSRLVRDAETKASRLARIGAMPIFWRGGLLSLFYKEA